MPTEGLAPTRVIAQRRGGVKNGDKKVHLINTTQDQAQTGMAMPATVPAASTRFLLRKNHGLIGALHWNLVSLQEESQLSVVLLLVILRMIDCCTCSMKGTARHGTAVVL